MLPIFIINLPQSTERLEACINSCQKLGLTAEVFVATNGREILDHPENNHDLFSKVVLQDQTHIDLPLGRHVTMDDPLSPGEVGCALSHLRLYQEILDRKLEYALVLEDDAILKEPCVATLKAIVERKDQWDIVQLSHDSGIRRFFWTRSIKLTDEISMRREGMGFLDPLFNRRRCSYLTSCYLINAKACKKLIELGYPVRFPADFLLGFPTYHQLRLYTCHPQRLLLDCNGFGSTIVTDPMHPQANTTFHRKH